MMKHTAEDARNALAEAKAFARSGEYEKALERHEWFHANALACDEALRGVRLSFALAYWKELGAVYPPAMKSLRAIRDSGAAALSGPDAAAAMFCDVAAIDSVLGQSEETVRLFKKLDAENPELAKECFRYADELLLDTGEAELFCRYADGLAGWLREQIGRFEAIRSNPQSVVRDSPEVIQSLANRLVETTLKLTDIAIAQGDTTAVYFKKMTSKVIDDPRL
jgi:tetratricopeptide (TPR) repeat protein